MASKVAWEERTIEDPAVSTIYGAVAGTALKTTICFDALLTLCTYVDFVAVN